MENRLCSKCEISKPLSEFYTYKERNRSNWCKQCRIKMGNLWRRKDRALNREKYNAKNREWRKDNAGKSRQYHLKKVYGVTMKEWDNLVIKQNGKCAICDKKTKLTLDHSHITGKTRGLLCRNCNAGLGLLGDNVNILKLAIKYMEGRE